MKVEIDFNGTGKEFDIEIISDKGLIECYSIKVEYVYKYNLATDNPEFIFKSVQGAKWNAVTDVYYPYVFTEEECEAIETQMEEQIDWEEVIDYLNNWNNRD